MKRRSFVQSCGSAIFGPLKARLSAAAAQPLEEGFRRPPASARPFTLVHWMNGNVTAEGITRDLEAMARVGIGGFQIFRVGTGIPAGPVQYGRDEHLTLLEHAAREAGRLGLVLEMHNCPGWSSSGGPWNPTRAGNTANAMERGLHRGWRRVEITLPRPLTRLGYYRDVRVLAFPSLPGERRPRANRSAAWSAIAARRMQGCLGLEGRRSRCGHRAKASRHGC
ncbi:MAG: glycosyl hydrolase [Bryobacterales bacterium]|nr:glycosyl hydrolase [Bryobacterales bacterium]